MIKLKDINKKYGKKQIINDISFDVEDRRNRSGLQDQMVHGKTTTINMITGITDPTMGLIYKKNQ